MWKHWYYCSAIVGQGKNGMTIYCNVRNAFKPVLFPWVFCGGDYCLKLKRQESAKHKEKKE